MPLSTLRRLGRSAFNATLFMFGPAVNDPLAELPLDVKGLARRLRDAQERAQPGFMALHAVREGAHIVDFEWDEASAAATRLLAAELVSLQGQRLVEVLAGRAGRGAVFDQYRRVVEQGAAKALLQPVEFNNTIDVLRHAAVRWHDGVMVRLTNLSAVRRELALRREIHARALMIDSAPRA